MEKLWNYAFESKLQLNPTEADAVFVTQSPSTSKEDQERLVTLLLETLQVEKMYLGIDAVMSLISRGLTTGLVLDSGRDLTHSVPVFEGFAIPWATEKIEIAGTTLTQYAQRLLKERN